MKLKKKPDSKKVLNDIADRLKAGAKYEDLLDELDLTLGLDKGQEPSEAMDKEWEENYRGSK